MKKQKSIKFNLIMNSILTMSSFLFPLITFPYISRTLLAEGVGKVSFAISIVSFFLMFAQMGIPTYGIRACAQVRDSKEELSKTVQEIFIINSIMMILSYLVLTFMLFAVPRFSTDRILYIIVSLSILFNTLGIEWMYKALEEYSYITTRSIIFKFASLIAMFLLVKSPNDYHVYAAISIFAGSASSILNFIRANKYIKLKPLKNYCFKKHIFSIIVFFSMACATTIYTNLDSVMLGFMTSDKDVGYYTTSIKIKNILASIVSSLGVVLLPRVSYYVKNNFQEEFKQITNKALKFVFLVACPLIVYFTLFAKKSIHFLAGDTFTDSVVPMKIILLTLLFIGLTNVMGIQILVPLGRERQVLYSVIVGAIVNLCLNLLLIPMLGISGAAIGTLFAEITVFIVQCWLLRSMIWDGYKNIKYWKILTACILAAVIAVFAGNNDFGILFSLLLSSICFFGVYGIVLIILKEEFLIEVYKPMIRKIHAAMNRRGDR